MVDKHKWMVLGVEQFNRLEFMEAHDSWEHVWMTKPGDDAVFAQGLIQLAAAYLHIKRGTSPGGTLRLFDSALRKLSPYAPRYCGVERSTVIAAAERHRESLRREGRVRLAENEFPRFEMIAAGK